MSRDVVEILSDAGGAYISLVLREEVLLPRTVIDRVLGRSPKEQVETEIRTRKWSRMRDVVDGWLEFAPVEFDLEPGMYVAVCARRYPSDPEPVARMALRQPIPAAGRVRITPRIKVDEDASEVTL